MGDLMSLMRQYVRIGNMCDSHNREYRTDIKPWACVKVMGEVQEFTPDFYAYPVEEYEFAVDIEEGRPKFHSDDLKNYG